MKAKDLLLLRNYPSLLIYGPSGVGKTGLVSQAKNSYMFDFDDGMRTAAILEDKFTAMRHDCEFDPYDDSNPATPTGWMKMINKLNGFAAQSARGQLPWDCIIVDSLTGMVKSLQLHTMNIEMGDSFKKPQIQHWGTMVNEVEKVLTILRSLKCLLIITAHEMSFDVDNINLIRPLSITEKHSKNKLAWLFDEVLHMHLRPAGAGNYKYMLSGTSTRSIMARTRSTMHDDVDVKDIGLEGVLDKIKYNIKHDKKGEDIKAK